MSNSKQDSIPGGVAAIAALQGGGAGPQANKPGSKEGLKCPQAEEGVKCPQADADIFNALFSKWGRDEEANMVGSFDDLLWDEGAAAAAAASMGWQRTATSSAPSQQLSKPLQSEQQQNQVWEQASLQQQQQEQQSKPGSMIGQQLLYGRTIINPVLPKVRLAAKEDSFGDNVQCTAPPPTPSAAATAAAGSNEAAKLVCSAAMQQVHPGSIVPAPLSAATPMATAAAAQNAAEQLLESMAVSHQHVGSLQQLSSAFAAEQGSVSDGRMLPQLSLQSMLHLQHQLMADTAAAPTAFQSQQQVVPAVSSLYSCQVSAQQVVQPAAAAANSCLPGNLSGSGGFDAAAANLGSMLGLGGLQPGGLGGGLDAAAAVMAMQTALQQQQQLLRPPGLSPGLPFPEVGPAGFGWLGNNAQLTTSAPFGVSPAAASGFNPAAPFATGVGAQQPVVAGQQLLLQQTMQHLQQQQLLLKDAQAPQHQVAAGLSNAQTDAVNAAVGANSTRQSFTTMFGETVYPAAGPAAAAAAGGASGGLGLMGPPPPHAPPNAAAAAAAAAAAGTTTNSNSMLSQLPGQLPQLPVELLNAVGLGGGQMGGVGLGAAAGLHLPALPNLSPLFAGSWPLHLAGLLRPPPVQTTNVLQLAMMMQSAMQASPVPGAADTQQAAMVVAALQGLVANMQMLMPWTNNPTPWQPRPVVARQQELLNGSCLASGGVLPWQLSSSYGGGGQKATLHFSSQPQTSTTEISGQAGLPGCHSHSTAVAAAAAAAGAPMAGLTGAGVGVLNFAGMQRLDSLERHEAAAKPKQKRKQRHPENRARYEGRKIRANNRVRVKGRFVKVGPNGPILPGSEAIEQHHSEHEASDAELTDPEAREHHHSSSGKPGATAGGTAVAAAAPTSVEAGGISQVRLISATGTEEAALPPAGDTAVPGSTSAGGLISSRGAGVDAVCSAGAHLSWPEDVIFKSWHVEEPRVKPCCTGGSDACPVSGPAAGDRPCVGHVGHSSEGRLQPQHQCKSRQCKGAAGGCLDDTRALGHAGDGPCCCDDPVCSSGGPGGAAGASSEGCGATSISSLGLPADGGCSGVANRLVCHHSHKATAGPSQSTCSEQRTAANPASAAVVGMLAGAGQCLKRDLELTVYSSLGTCAAAGTGAAGLPEPSSKRRKGAHSYQQLDQQRHTVAGPDAAEAAAMPVPESEMPHPASLLEHLQQQQAPVVGSCEADAYPVPTQSAAPLLPSAANLATVGTPTETPTAVAINDELACADVEMAEAADTAQVVPEASDKIDAVGRQDQVAADQDEVDVANCSRQVLQLTATSVPAARSAPNEPDTACPATNTVTQLTAAADQATTGQAAVTGPAGDVAAAALQHWTSTQHQLGSPTPAQPLQPSLWGSALGFRAWGTARPVGAGVLAPPSLPLGMPLSVNLLAAAPFSGVPGVGRMHGTGSGASGALQVRPDIPALPAVTAGSIRRPAPISLTATLTALQQQAASPGAGSPAAVAGAGSFSPWGIPGALLGPPGPLAAAAAAAVAGLPVGVGRPASCSPAPQLIGGQLVPGHVSQLVPLHGGCWPLAAAAVGRFAPPPQRPPRQRRRGQAGEESEQTDSCPK